MPMLVHITDEKNSVRIKRSGIALGGYRRVVYFMPVVQDHFISHQWLRELRRGGARVLVGVYFRLPSEELVWAGRYNETHRQVPLGSAIRELNSLVDPLGFEIFIDRKIAAAAITRIRHLPQKIGWRYMPHAHGKKPCGCPACLPKGSIESRSIRERYDPEPPPARYETLRRTLTESSDPDSLIESLWLLRYKRRKTDPAFLERLMSFENIEVQDCADVKEAAAESLFQLYRQEASAMLSAFVSDPAISKVIEERQAHSRL